MRLLSGELSPKELSPHDLSMDRRQFLAERAAYVLKNVRNELLGA